MKKLRVTVEGKVYEVLVEMLDEDTAAPAPASSAPVTTASITAPVVARPAPKPAPAAAGVSGDVLCPMTGKLMSFDVQIGQTVAEGTQVATVEAMKMNTYVYASKAGKVLEFVAKPGDTVEEHAVLLRIG